MDPSNWDAGEVERSLRPDAQLTQTEGISTAATEAMVVGSTGPFATLAGRKALQCGGSAIDAVLTAALTQIALAAGSWVSYAGVLCLVHCRADGQTDSLSAGFATFANERDPLSIPAAPRRSGRTALVPGFMSGAQAAHDRFGKLSWAELFTPAIHIAENGFPVGAIAARQFELRKDLLPASFHATAGATFRQSELARTLRSIAAEGAQYMYTGAWAHRFVEVVTAAGGAATAGDLAAYQPVWGAPLQSNFGDYQLRALGKPDDGGERLLTALRQAQDLGDPMTDPRALAELIRISRDDDASGSHSDFVLACDSAGNVAAVCHSINTSLWGSTGLFVDGISIPDAASFQQSALAELTAGQHLPFVANPAIALRDGVPVLASSSIGAGLHPVTLQCLHAALNLGVPVQDVVRRPLFHGPDAFAGDSVNTAMVARASTDSPPTVIEDGFDADILRATERLGQHLAIRPTADWSIPRGYWGGISLGDHIVGGRTGFSSGSVEGY